MIRRDIQKSTSFTAELKRSVKRCPDCGAVAEGRHFHGFGRGGAEAIRYAVRKANLVRNDPTREMLLHAEMHVANALTLLKEAISARKSTAIEAKNELQSDARIKVEKNLAKIMVHLQFAADCASGFPELHSFLLEAEEMFQHEGSFLDLDRFRKELEKALKTC